MRYPRIWRRRILAAAVLIAVAVLVRLSASAGSASPVQPGAPASSPIDNVVLITLDGVRIQEIFGGLDLDVLRSSIPPDASVEQTRAYRRYWAPTAEASRERVMPFLWTVLMAQHGSIAGNPARGSSVRVTNRHRFSYPGYAELLLGEAHDDVIDSNDKRRNPYPTVLEFLKQRLRLDKERVAAFASWDTFDWIVEHEAGTITSNAGFDAYDGAGPAVDRVNRLQSEALTPWDAARHDAYTFELAMAHVKQFRPRVLYLAFDETDDWAHDGRYDRVLDSLHATDGYLRELWSVVQRDDAYRDRTAVVITADHGRGNTPADWRDHGSKIDGAEQIWMAFASPRWPRRGEWRDNATIYQNQVAATLAQALGIDYEAQHPNAGRPIVQLLSRD
jgi:Type I phosphodiesterase / nucleotide pyrophosphatase